MRRGILLFVLFALLPFVWLVNTQQREVREYRHYLLEDRPAAQMDWKRFSETWAPDTVKEQFPGNNVQCDRETTGHPGVSLRCTVYLKSLNGVPTMYMNYWFSDERLVRVASAIPWWSHGNAMQYLESILGSPHRTQDQQASGIRLIGWRLDEGGSIVYNRDQGHNPLEFNSIQWLSATACKGQPCVH